MRSFAIAHNPLASHSPSHFQPLPPCQNGDPICAFSAQLTLTKPICEEFSRKHCLQMSRPYLRMIPPPLPQTRQERDPLPYFRGWPVKGLNAVQEECQTTRAQKDGNAFRDRGRNALNQMAA